MLMKTTQCEGDGLGSCKRCEDYGMDSRNWMCFLHKIEGMEGKYCEYCVKEMEENAESEDKE